MWACSVKSTRTYVIIHFMFNTLIFTLTINISKCIIESIPTGMDVVVEGAHLSLCCIIEHSKMLRA